MAETTKAQNLTVRKTTISHERLCAMLSYDSLTGVLAWRVRPNRRILACSPAGTKDSRGYIDIIIDGEKYRAHRLAWFIFTGNWPGDFIDHKNGDRSDNRWSNLRECSQSENLLNRGPPSNNSSGFKGVVWNKRDRKWIAKASLRGVYKYLGCYDDPVAAHEAYNKFALANHGEFAFHGRLTDIGQNS